MIQTGGFVLLFAWLLFAALLFTLAAVVLRVPVDPIDEATRRPDELLDPSKRPTGASR